MKREFSDELISAYLDGELTSAEQAEVEDALRSRGELRQMVDDFQRLREELERLPRQQLDDGFAERVMRRAERARGTEKASAIGGGETTSHREEGAGASPFRIVPMSTSNGAAPSGPSGSSGPHASSASREEFVPARLLLEQQAAVRVWRRAFLGTAATLLFAIVSVFGYVANQTFQPLAFRGESLGTTSEAPAALSADYFTSQSSGPDSLAFAPQSGPSPAKGSVEPRHEYSLAEGTDSPMPLDQSAGGDAREKDNLQGMLGGLPSGSGGMGGVGGTGGTGGGSDRGLPGRGGPGGGVGFDGGGLGGAGPVGGGMGGGGMGGGGGGAGDRGRKMAGIRDQELWKDEEGLARRNTAFKSRGADVAPSQAVDSELEALRMLKESAATRSAGSNPASSTEDKATTREKQRDASRPDASSFGSVRPASPADTAEIKRKQEESGKAGNRGDDRAQPIATSPSGEDPGSPTVRDNKPAASSSGPMRVKSGAPNPGAPASERTGDMPNSPPGGASRFDGNSTTPALPNNPPGGPATAGRTLKAGGAPGAGAPAAGAKAGMPGADAREAGPAVHRDADWHWDVQQPVAVLNLSLPAGAESQQRLVEAMAKHRIDVVHPQHPQQESPKDGGKPAETSNLAGDVELMIGQATQEQFVGVLQELGKIPGASFEPTFGGLPPVLEAGEATNGQPRAGNGPRTPPSQGAAPKAGVEKPQIEGATPAGKDEAQGQDVVVGREVTPQPLLKNSSQSNFQFYRFAIRNADKAPDASKTEVVEKNLKAFEQRLNEMDKSTRLALFVIVQVMPEKSRSPTPQPAQPSTTPAKPAEKD